MYGITVGERVTCQHRDSYVVDVIDDGLKLVLSDKLSSLCRFAHTNSYYLGLNGQIEILHAGTFLNDTKQ